MHSVWEVDWSRPLEAAREWDIKIFQKLLFKANVGPEVALLSEIKAIFKIVAFRHTMYCTIFFHFLSTMEVYYTYMFLAS